MIASVVNGVHPTDDVAVLTAKKLTLTAQTSCDVAENYDGDYRFAPIEEAQVSRAMIKRCVDYCSLV